MNRNIFKSADIRGIYPNEINDEVVQKVAKVCTGIFPEGEVIVAHDARHGSEELSIVMAQTLEKESENLGKKISVRQVGLSSTPMFYFLVKYFKASGGCMITASHNPKQYNGMKIVDKNAELIPGTEILSKII